MNILKLLNSLKSVRQMRLLWEEWSGILRASCVLVLALLTGAQGQVPTQINYQGRLTDAAGNPVAGSRTIAVRLYDAATGGNRVYEETVGTVALGPNGVYSFQFGAAGAGIAATLNGSERHLALVVDGVEQGTRTRLLAVPYAMKSADAQALASDVAAMKAEFRVIGLPATLEFGRWAVGVGVKKTLVIKNAGFGRLTVSGITYPAGFSGAWSGTIEGGAVQDVEVTFAPTQSGGYGGQMTVLSDAATGVTNVAISGEGVPLPQNFVKVDGGILPSSSALGAVPVSAFFIGKYEVQWGEFQTVRTWASANGYDIGNAGSGSGSNYPVESVNWYQALKWCNARSEMEGLTPVYKNADGSVYRTGDSVPASIASTYGYRLPIEKEWEWAARGGMQSQSYTYSGGNNINLVGWYSFNSGNVSHVVGGKASNELGLYDMSGNAAEWCFDDFDGSGVNRVIRGGSFIRLDSYCTVSGRESRLPSSSGGSGYGGFRLILNSVH